VAAALIGLGIDVVDLDRFRMVLGRRPRVAERLFTEGERHYASLQRDPTRRLAVRFAAKEATMKALGVGLGAFAFRDVEVVALPSHAPALRLTGRAAEVAAHAGVIGWKVSLTHGDLVAEAVVVAL
jgi:holo-[acyl-carrier protein] synthase